MGKTFSTGLLTNGLWQDASNNIGIGGSPSGSYKFEVTGTGRYIGANTNTLNISQTSGSTTLAHIGQFSDGTYISNNWYYSGGQQNDNTSLGGASINLQSSATTGASNINFSLKDAGSGGVSAKMTILSSGNVGIGTSSPVQTLHLKAASGSTTGLRLESSGGTTNFDILSSEGDGNVYLYQRSNYGILFGTNNTERMRITSGGKVIIGTTSTTYGTLLGVQTSSSPEPVGHFYNSRNTSGDRCFYMQMGANARDTSSYYLQCFDSIDVMYIYGNGNIVNRNNSYGTLSDVSLKENIVDATPKLDDLLQLKVRNFNLIDDESKIKQIGFIAQEFEEVFPTMIDIDGKSGMKTIKTSVLVPMLVKAMQEQQDLINELSAKVSALENKS